MAFDLPRTSIITVEDVVVAAAGSHDLSQEDHDTRESLTRIADAVTGVFEEGLDGSLNRRLIVRKHSQRVLAADWRYDTLEERYFVTAREWPVIKVLTSGYTFGVSPYGSGEHALFALTSASAKDAKIEYYAGYRRSDQQPEFSDLTVEEAETIPLVPSAVQAAAVNAALYMFLERGRGPGQIETNIAAGSAQVSFTSADAAYIDRQLANINHYRYTNRL